MKILRSRGTKPGRVVPLALVAALLPVAARAQEAASTPTGLAAHSGTLLVSFFVLLAILVLLLVWEFVESRREVSFVAGSPIPAGSPYQAATAQEAPPEEDDPFRSLLQKASSDKAEMERGAVARVESRVEVAASSWKPAEPAPLPSQEEDEELSPFHRLAQIGTEDQGGLLERPAARPQRIDLGGGPKAGAPEAGGGDWAALLSKVQGGGAGPPVAPAQVASPGAESEEDPWRKLLAGGAGEAAAPTAEEDQDPWQALFQKTALDQAQAPSAAPAPQEATPPEAPPGRIRLGVEGAFPPPAPDPENPGAPRQEEGARPRSISLDLKREPARPAPPPPQTEDE